MVIANGREVKSVVYGRDVFSKNAINGLIKEYKVATGENISAGDFVKYINDINKKIDFSIDSYKRNNDSKIESILLSENKIFICTGNISSNFSGLYGYILTIENNNISLNLAKRIINTYYSAQSFSILKVTNTKIFLAYSETYSLLKVALIDISENDISLSNAKTVFAGGDAQKISGSLLLNDNKVFVCWRARIGENLSNHLPYGIVIQINNDNTFTCGDYLRFSDEQNEGTGLYPVKISDNKVFLFSAVGASSWYLLVRILNINNLKITIKGGTAIDSAKYTGEDIFALPISNNQILIQGRGGSNSELYGRVISYNNSDEISIYDKILFNTNEGKLVKTRKYSTLNYNGNKFITIYYDATLKNMNLIVFKIENNYVIQETFETILEGIEFSPNNLLKLNDNKFIFYYTSGEEGTLQSLILLISPSVSILQNSLDKIYGVAKQSGASGQNIQIYVPEVYNEIH